MFNLEILRVCEFLFTRLIINTYINGPYINKKYHVARNYLVIDKLSSRNIVFLKLHDGIKNTEI